MLTFSLADAYVERMKWGIAQPETVRDYQIELRANGIWHQVASVTGNYQRRNVIEFAQQSFNAMRITVLATNGLDHARIFEVRVS